MKKNSNKGFVLAETLVTTVFLMVIFTMIYTNFYPLIGEYEKRENYDTADGKYAAFWIKNIVEDENYGANSNAMIKKKYNLKNYGYFRVECSDFSDSSQIKNLCMNLVKDYEINGCSRDGKGNSCDIYLTKYQIGETTPNFKEHVKTNLKKWEENCFTTSGAVGNAATCKADFINKCISESQKNPDVQRPICEQEANKKVFSSALRDYIAYLPNYTTPSLNLAPYRVIIVIHHTKDYNNYLSYSTIEVNR